jgi:hypothetical protein
MLAKLIGLSEKQYQAPAGLARSCRFFLPCLPALDRALLLSSATPSDLINRIPYYTAAALSSQKEQRLGMA